MKPSQIQRLPEDPDIPALRAVELDGLEALLEKSGIGGPFDSARIVRYVPGSRLTLCVTGPDGPMAVKAYRKSPKRTIAALKLLESAGFASGTEPTAAPLLGFEESLMFTVHTWFQAPSGFELMHAGKGERAGEIAAEWITATHLVQGDIGRNYSAGKVLGWARRWASAISSAQPALERDAAAATALLAASVPKDGSPGLRHGAFGPKHVFDLGTGPGVIDWDSPKSGAVELDCAIFLAKLAKCAVQSEDLAPDLHCTADSFRRGVSSIADEGNLLWYEAAFCLKCATYRSNEHGDRSTGHVKALLDKSAELARERNG